MDDDWRYPCDLGNLHTMVRAWLDRSVGSKVMVISLHLNGDFMMTRMLISWKFHSGDLMGFG